MDTSLERIVHADRQVVYELAARVDDWPRILPHYRLVRRLDDGGRIEMSCVRPLFGGSTGIPLRWQAVQTLRPSERIEFFHVGGPTRGMQVAWTFEDTGDGAVRVRIRHVFTPTWPVPDALVHQVVGEFFVNGVAERTLRRIAELAEARRR